MESPSSDSMQEVLAAISIAVDEAIWSPSRQDEAAQQDEHVFQKRFGFDANREQRRLIIGFKHEADVTDAEIRILRKSGSLAYHTGKVEILAPGAIALFGYVQIIVLCMLMILPMVGLAFKPRLSWLIGVGLPMIEILLLYLVKLSDDIYIRPHRIRKRVLQQSNART